MNDYYVGKDEGRGDFQRQFTTIDGDSHCKLNVQKSHFVRIKLIYLEVELSSQSIMCTRDPSHELSLIARQTCKY